MTDAGATVAPRDAAGVSCVVVAFHRPAPLQRLLAALAHRAIQRIVVNVEDDPAVAEVVRRAGAVVVPTAANVGYAAAVNTGVAHACAPVVAFMNDDLDLGADAVLSLAAAVRSGECDVCVPRVIDDAGRVEPTIAALPTPSRLLREWTLLPDHPVRALHRLVQAEKWRAPQRPERILAAAAVIVAVRTTLLRRIPLPETYFLYWEESEWFWRLRAAPAVVMYHPDILVRHSGGRDDVRPEKSALLARNAVRCVRRTQGRPRAAIAWPVVVLWNLRLVGTDLLRALLGRSKGDVRLRARAAGLRAALAAWREV